jgi:hypothetical protein
MHSDGFFLAGVSAEPVADDRVADDMANAVLREWEARRTPRRVTLGELVREVVEHAQEWVAEWRPARSKNVNIV